MTPCNLLCLPHTVLIGRLLEVVSLFLEARVESLKGFVSDIGAIGFPALASTFRVTLLHLIVRFAAASMMVVLRPVRDLLIVVVIKLLL